MRPILVNIPSKLLLGVALVLAAAFFVRDLLRRRKDPKAELTSTPLYLLAGAEALIGFKSGSWTPSVAGIFSTPWTPVPIYAYGVMLGTSLVVGWFIAMRLAKQDGVPEQDAGTIYMWTAVWSIIGSRLLYILTNLNEFDSVVEMLMVNRGGLVAYGGMIGGFFASWYGCRKRGIELLRWADVSAPSVVLGTAITRVGCLLFGCDYGRRTDLPWAIRFPGKTDLAPTGSPAWQHHVREFRLPETADWSFPVHPTQIYESLVGLSLFALLMFVRKKRQFSGQVFLAWVFGYGIMRPLIEIVRDDDQRGNVGALSTSQFIGIVSVIAGLGLLIALVRKYRRDPAASRLWELPLRQLATAGGAPVEAAGKARGAKRRKRA
jgi:phosphatidylglycerol:prolipoprotein diacylglycerol transferase